MGKNIHKPDNDQVTQPNEIEENEKCVMKTEKKKQKKTR